MKWLIAAAVLVLALTAPHLLAVEALRAVSDALAIPQGAVALPRVPVGP